ncbi:hypothetical protein [Streptomyces sp. CA-111067]|uniref:hypothetical protein n=1 Tax=Streptomyces sp. CA-111067 TaxID=3240046 RepID=UPI003D990FFB
MGTIQPQMPLHAYQTFEVRAPLATHFRAASCAEVDCAAHLRGWSSVIDERTELGQRQAYYIRRESGRRCTETRDDAGLTHFAFEAGQSCFAADKHRVRRQDVPELYFVRQGHWLGARTPSRKHATGADWTDEFATHQDRLSTLINRG